MPDAWEDDWIDKGKSTTSTPDPTRNVRLSQAERRRQQAELNKQLWENENTEKQEDNFFLQTQGIVPNKSDFKPAMKVLSRKPDGGIEGLSLDGDDEEDGVKKSMTPEERMQKAQKDREEKQKVYEERRRELFSKDTLSANAKPTPKSKSPRNQSRVKGAGDSRPSSAASNNKSRQLFDPNESTKPESMRPQKQDSAQILKEPIREPKAPDGSGRGGRGFTSRGGCAS